VADSKAYSRRTLAYVWSTALGYNLRPRTGAIRSGLESLGPPAPCLAPPGGEARADQRRRAAPLAMGHSVLHRVEVEDSEGGSPGGGALCRRAFQSAGPAACPDVCRCAREGSGGRLSNTCGRCKHSGSLACPMPRPPSPHMRAAGQAVAGAGRAPGGITRSAMA